MVRKFKPDLIIEEVRHPNVGALSRWHHRAVALALVDARERHKKLHLVHWRRDVRAARGYEEALLLGLASADEQLIPVWMVAGTEERIACAEEEEVVRACSAACLRALSQRMAGTSTRESTGSR